MLNKGFYTALGTPLDNDGKVIKDSLIKHINNQIEAGASGLLLMGSMGIEACVPHSEYKKVVDVGIEATNGRVPLFVGAMDNSIARVKERLEMIGKGRKIDGIVLTTPFYKPANEKEAIWWFTNIADISPYPIFIYDLAVITRFNVNMNVIDAVIKHPNIKGMKSAN
ncbi:MAG: dihydrodipicolinate synthase family protein, partial [Clostridia bacterium]|nr:dihydrodipicolinate synthase family protein [Clostridia bacterium]